MLSYSELIEFPTFEERYDYCKLNGAVGEQTFAGNRIFNQRFYTSPEWRRVRAEVITRDKCCDLAVPDREIQHPLIHHLNPITIDDISEATKLLLDPENLVVVSHATHNAIHYGDDSLLVESKPLERRPGDTCPWKVRS